MWHLLAGTGFIVVSLVGIALGERVKLRQKGRAPKPGADEAATMRQRLLLPVVALAGIGAAAVHFVVMPEHFEEAAIYGTFFAFAASMQLLYSLWLLMRPSRPLLLVGALGNLVVVGLWLVTRLVSIPLGPSAGETESFGGLDVLASSFEAVVVVGAGVLAWSPMGFIRALRPRAWSRVVWPLVAVVAAAVVTTAYISPPS